jgi:apolipoprotein N-acyltransferase
VGARLYAPTGAVALRYHKMRLVPFGEYVPLSGLLETLGVKKLVQEVGDFVPGEAITLGRAEGRTLGAFICYEAIFPDLVREFAQQGAELLVNITNDGWYGRTSAPYQHLAMARFRAVENGRPLLRAANTGITAIIDARGRVQRQTQLFERTVLVDDVEVAVEDTFYARHGDVFGWLCCAVTLAMAIYGGARRAPAGDPSD